MSKVNNEKTTSTKRFKLALPSEIKNAEGEDESVDILAYTGKSVDLSDYGIEHPVVYNTSGIKYKNRIPFLYEHYKPIGHVENISKSNGRITCKGYYSYPGERTDEVKNAIKKGFPMQSSMGLDIDASNVTFVSEGVVEVNNQTFNAPIYVVNECVLIEQTATMFGRDEDTNIISNTRNCLMKVKNSKNNNPSEEKGSDENTQPTPPTPPVTENSNPAPTQPPTQPPAVHVNHSMIFRLSRLAGNDEDAAKIIENGLENGWDEERITDAVKLHKLEKDYPEVPSPGKTREASSLIKNELTARIAMSLNVSEDFLAKKFDEKTVDTAIKNGTMSLREMLTVVANSNGGNFTGHSDIEEACRFLKRFNNNQQYSTISFPNLLDTVTQFRMEEYWGIGQPWAVKHLMPQSQSNFKPTGRIRPSGGQLWDQLDKDGRIQHGSAGEEKTYMTYLQTIAQLLTFKRQTIIDDDLGVIEELMGMMVEGALMAPDFMFVNKLYDGIGSFFKVSKGNAAFGAGAALDEDALDHAYSNVRKHNIKKGDKNVQNFFDTKWMIVVPDDLEKTAWELIKQKRIVSNTTANTKQGEENYWFGRLEISTFANLDNPSYHSLASSDVWGIMPIRKSLAPYSITYLNNRREPTTEIVDLPADMLGFGVRGYWDLWVNEREDEAVFFNFPSVVDPEA